MSIPFVSNLGFTEVSSSGSLNDKAGADKIKLPVQFFKLTGDISGNLSISNNATHKKIIIDTNGNDIINNAGSPITNDSDVTVEIKGSGDVQSTLKTFTTTVDSTSNTGTTTISAADNSTVLVEDDAYTYEGQIVDVDRSAGSGNSFGDGNTSVTQPDGSGGSSQSYLVNEQYYSAQYGIDFGGTALTNINKSTFGMSFTHAFLEDGTPISGAIVGPSGPSTFDGVSALTPSSNDTYPIGSDTYRVMRWNNAVQGVNRGNSGTFDILIFINVGNGYAVVAIIGGRGAFNQIKNVDIFGDVTGRRLTFTNNLAISCVLSGADPYDGVTVSAGSTAVANRNSTDGSFNITGTISGSDGSSRPYALKDVNDGSGSISTSELTGTISVSGF